MGASTKMPTMPSFNGRLPNNHQPILILPRRFLESMSDGSHETAFSLNSALFFSYKVSQQNWDLR